MSCEVCQIMRQKLESERGNRITHKLIDSIMGTDLSVLRLKVCEICGQGHYAKGLCYKHYMVARRGEKTKDETIETELQNLDAKKGNK